VGGGTDRIYLDLGQPDWQVVEVSPEGWRLVACPPVYFRRTKGLLALPQPAPGGDLSALCDILNLGDQRNWQLAVAWLLGCLMPQGPYPVLVLYGEQGSAKSTTAKGLRSLIDPHATLLRAAPREERDLAVAAHNGWVIGFDNLSNVRPWLSDALCQVLTGAGFAGRKLYTDDEEAVIVAARPALLNGIAAEMIGRPDLLDRSLVLELPLISNVSRKTEAEVWGQLQAERPRLLGALLDAAVVGLRNLHTQPIGELPRMADFAKWVEACGPALGWRPGEFLAAYGDARADLEYQALILWPVYHILEGLLKQDHAYQGTVLGFLQRLNDLRHWSEDATLKAEWPRTAKALATELRRFAPALRRVGIEVQWLKRRSTGCQVHIWRRAPQTAALPAEAG
jgi:hypothetical protein